MPTKLRLLHGEDHLDRMGLDEPAPAPERPELPTDAAQDVREVWDRIVAELEAMDLAFSADSDGLRCYAEAVVVHRKASAVLARTGVLVRGIHGNLVRNPALQAQRDAAATIRAWSQEFGLTPSARTSIRGKEAAGAGGSENPFADASGT